MSSQYEVYELSRNSEARPARETLGLMLIFSGVHIWEVISEARKLSHLTISANQAVRATGNIVGSDIKFYLNICDYNITFKTFQGGHMIY